MSTSWDELTRLTLGRNLTVQKVAIENSDIAIEGDFELPPLAKLSADDQVFIAAFVRCHGSIKRMEEAFGISYPTVKNRLNRIAMNLSFVTAEVIKEPAGRTDEAAGVLDRLERGEISTEQALEELG